jgi:hypothetical protein
MTTKQKARDKKKDLVVVPNLVVVPDFGGRENKDITVRMITKPTQINIMQIDDQGRDTSKHMMAQTYIIDAYGNQPARAIHFVKASYGFDRVVPESDIEYRWRVSKLTGTLYIPVKIEKHLITAKLLGLSDFTVSPETNELVLKKDGKDFGFTFTPDIDDKGNFSVAERRRCELEQATLAKEGKQLVPEIDKPLYTDVKIRFNLKPTFYIWDKPSEYRKTCQSIHVEASTTKILPLPPATYHYSPFDYAVTYSYEYLSMLAGLGGDLMGQLALAISEHMSGYDDQPDVYPPEVKDGDKPLPFQLPLAYKADPRNAKLLLLRRKYMIFITPIKKAKVKASSILPSIAFNWEDDKGKWTGSCDKQMQSGTFLEPEQYIQQCTLAGYQVNFTNKSVVKAVVKRALCSLADDNEQAILRMKQFEEQLKLERRQSRKSKKRDAVEIPNS